MKYEDIVKFLGYLGAAKIENTGQWAKTNCPLAPWKHESGKDSNPSFGIKIEPGKRSFFNCFSCHSGGSLDDLLAELLHFNKDGKVPMELALAFKLIEFDAPQGFMPSKWHEFHVVTSASDFEPFPEWWLDSFKKAIDVPRARAYLNGRQIDDWLIEEFDVRYDSMRDAVCFPFRNAEGVLAGMRGRYIEPLGELRYHDYDYKGANNTHHVWFNEHRVDWDKTVVLTEGAIDAISVYRWYRNVLTPLSAGASKEKLDRLKNAVKVLCFFDNDKAGMLAYEKVKEAIGKNTLVRKVIFPTWANDGADANSIGAQSCRDLLAKYLMLDLPPH